MQTSLRANSVASKQTVRGYVYFELEKHADVIRLTIPVGTKTYQFPFEFNK